MQLPLFLNESIVTEQSWKHYSKRRNMSKFSYYKKSSAAGMSTCKLKYLAKTHLIFAVVLNGKFSTKLCNFFFYLIKK